MVRLTEQALEIGYPKLSKNDIDAIIGALMHSLRDRELGADTARYERTLSYLIGFRTRRWGLPPAFSRL